MIGADSGKIPISLDDPFLVIAVPCKHQKERTMSLSIIIETDDCIEDLQTKLRTLVWSVGEAPP